VSILSIKHRAAPDWSPPAGLLSRSLAGGRAALNGQANVGSGTPVCLCSRESPAAARTSVGGGSHPHVDRRHPAGDPNRLLGSCPQADVRQTAAAPRTSALRRLGRAARATSQKAVPHCAPAERGARAPAATEGSSVVLRYTLSCLNTACFTGKQSFTKTVLPPSQQGLWPLVAELLGLGHVAPQRGRC